MIFFYPRAAFFLVGAAIFFAIRAKEPAAFRAIPPLGVPAYAAMLAIMSWALYNPEIHSVWLALPFGFLFFLDAVRQSRPLALFLQAPPMQFLGKISYSLYLWHPVITFPLKFAVAAILVKKLGANPIAAMSAFGILAITITIPWSWLSWRILEQEGGRLVRRHGWVAAHA